MRHPSGILPALLLAACAAPRADEVAPQGEVVTEPPRTQRELVRLPSMRVERFEWDPFPEEPPIHGADPAARRREVVRLPVALHVARERGRVAYGIDADLLDPVTLDVGYRMVLGYKINWTLRRDEVDPEHLCEEEGTMDCLGSPEATWRDDAPTGGGTIEAAIQVFETDIPPQHHWSPGMGQYRVLWQKTLKAPLPD